MSQTFKIRKNKSQKEIHLNHQLRRRSPLLVTQQIPQTKVPAHTNFHKIVQLEPLGNSKANIHNEGRKTQQIKLDFTQAIPHKSSSLNKQEVRPEGIHLEPIDPKGSQKRDYSEKENRPNSVNEIKYPTISKIYSTYIKTEQYDDKSSLTQMTQGLQHFRLQKESLNEDKKLFPEAKRSKMTLLKTTSRSKLAKIFNKQGNNERQTIVETEVEVDSEVSQKTFRKGILNKIFSQTRNTTTNPSPKEVSTLQEKEEDESKKIQDVIVSPQMKKDIECPWGNCSTIREQEQSCSSFLSKQGFQELINPQQIFQFLPFPEERGQLQRRTKMEVQKIKKKFPQNFFK